MIFSNSLTGVNSQCHFYHRPDRRSDLRSGRLDLVLDQDQGSFQDLQGFQGHQGSFQELQGFQGSQGSFPDRQDLQAGKCNRRLHRRLHSFPSSNPLPYLPLTQAEFADADSDLRIFGCMAAINSGSIPFSLDRAQSPVLDGMASSGCIPALIYGWFNRLAAINPFHVREQQKTLRH